MKIIRGLHNLIAPLEASAVTLGNFDGIHLGHQALLATLKQRARALGVPAVAVTFEPQPKDFFAGRPTVPRIMRFSEKYCALRTLGLDYLCCLYFDEALAKLSAEAFVADILLDKLGMRHIVVGYDFHFGADRRGDFALLAQTGHQKNFVAEEVPPVTLGSANVSSTRVRQALAAGDMKQVSVLLGKPYQLCGRVVYGDQRGRQLGFPTANINLHRELLPLSGVFVIRARCGNQYFDGVANVGIRPTFAGKRALLEVHLLDFNRVIYGTTLEVEFLVRLRPEKKYPTVSALVEQIQQDVAEAKHYLQKNRSA